MDNHEIIDNLFVLFHQYNDKFVKLYTDTIKLPDYNNVHDLRVNIRRLLALSDFIQSLAPCNHYKPLRIELKKILKILNPLRDTHVQISRIQRIITANSPIRSFFFHLLESERKLVINMKNNLVKDNLAGIEGLGYFFQLEIKNNLVNVSELEQSVFGMCSIEYDKLKLSRKATNINDLDSIHELRLSFKKYRYTIEIIQKLFKSDNTKNECLKKFQNILGAIQDNNALIKRLDDFIANLDKNESQFQKFRDKLIKQRILLIETLKKNLDLIDKIDFRLFLPRS